MANGGRLNACWGDVVRFQFGLGLLCRTLAGRPPLTGSVSPSGLVLLLGFGVACDRWREQDAFLHKTRAWYVRLRSASANLPDADDPTTQSRTRGGFVHSVRLAHPFASMCPVRLQVTMSVISSEHPKTENHTLTKISVQQCCLLVGRIQVFSLLTSPSVSGSCPSST